MVLREMGLQVGLFSANGDIWRRQRRMVMAGFDPRPRQGLLPVAAAGRAAPAGSLAEGGRPRRLDRSAGRPDALHGRRDRRPRVRLRGQHAGVRRRRDPAPPEPDLPGAVPPHPGAGALLALCQAARGSRARPQRARGAHGDRGLHRPGARSDRAGAGAPRASAQPARGDDQRGRRRRQRPRRSRRRRQRARDAAGRRGHDREHAGLADPLPARASGSRAARRATR